MKQKKYHGGSSGGESSEDERIIQPVEYEEEEHRGGEEEDDFFFESSQDLTQVVPRSVPSEGVTPSPKKKKKKEKGKDSMDPAPVSPPSRNANGLRCREVDVSEIPEHVLSKLMRILPKDSDCTEGLTIDDVEKTANSCKGDIWILQCPKTVSLSNLLTGKKLSLDFDGGQILVEDDEEDEPHLTQYAPTESLGKTVRNRQYEVVTVQEESFKQGMMMLVPDSNSFKMVPAPVNGRIIIREAVQTLATPTVDVQTPKPRELPTGVKERHPVYGADFTSIINKMEAKSGPSSKKKRKSHDEVTQSWQSIRSNGLYENSGFPSIINIKQEILDDEEISSRKKKKKKKNKHAEEDEPILNETVNGNCSVDADNSYEDGYGGQETGKQKKSRKRKREELDDSLDLNQTEILLHSNDDVVKKRKKSKHRE